MSKRKLLARGVIFGYGAIGTQMLYSFASIPLALSHLSKTEFGMWSLISTIGGYLMLAELGMTNAVMRHLFECKEGKDPGKYGRLFTASAMALALVAFVVMLLGVLAAFFSFKLFPVPEALHDTYLHVMLGQSLILAITMATRMLGAPLYVHHRQDLGQINQIGLFIIYYVVLFLGFRAGWGIYAMLVNQAVGVIWVVSFNFITCLRMGYYPKRGTWGLPNHEEWGSVWRHSKDLFVIQISGMILMSVPQLLVTRLLGLEAGATWTVFTRPFFILRQLVTRPFDVALPMLCDTYIRGDMRTVIDRWKEVTQVVLAVSGAAFVVAAANNSTFITLWTSGKMNWSETNQWMLALYFYIYTIACLAYGTIGLDKVIGRSRYVPLGQAVLTVAISYPLATLWGIPGLILATAVPFVFGMIGFGVRYLATITGFRTGPLAWDAIIRPSLALPCAALAAWSCAHMVGWLPGYYGLILSCATGSALALIMMIYLGVPREIRDQIQSMIWKLVTRVLPDRPAQA